MSDTEPHGFPLKDHLGFTIDYGQGTATATLELDERRRNPNGAVENESELHSVSAVTKTARTPARGIV